LLPVGCTPGAHGVAACPWVPKARSASLACP
jgi:hypothetical protein